LLSQAAEGQVVVAQQAATVDPGCGCNTGGPVRSSGFLDRFRGSRSYDNPGFFGRIGSRFGMGRSSGDYVTEGSFEAMPAQPTPEIMQRMPNKVSYNEPPLGSVRNVAAGPNADGAIAQVNFRPTAAGAAVSVIQTKFVDKVGHEEDYSWITGQLGQEGDRWVIYFATPETVDHYRGKLILAGNADMSSFHVGDLVSIEGGVIQSARGPAYLIRSINIVEAR
jgi:hypothetical protein